MTETDLKLLMWVVDARQTLTWMRDELLTGAWAANWPEVNELVLSCPAYPRGDD